ncbi:hypothetical protein Pst134EB_030770 [Puccinia striiformis f. sp. tritici]|nr:hypothetical protein Pst134EB_030770 [Puccinia striiformis f. sp. tritici]
MTVTRMIYNSIMKRNSTYVSTIFAGSFIFSIGFDTITSRWWEQHNKQVQYPLSSLSLYKKVKLEFFSLTYFFVLLFLEIMVHC